MIDNDEAIDFISFGLGVARGRKEGEQTIILETDGYQITDPNDDGNLVITQGDNES